MFLSLAGKTSQVAKALRGWRTSGWLTAALALLIFSLAYFSPVSYATSDPELSLVVSQAIVQHGVLYLDPYQEALGPLWETSAKLGNLLPRNGHYYYYFPIGTSLFSSPFVWIANQTGRDMAVLADNHDLQNLLSAVLCAAVFLVLFGLCRCYLESDSGALKPRRFSETYGVWASLVIATVSVMGSALISTAGTALWNVDWAVLFIALMLWLLARYDSGRATTIHPYWSGFLLFAIYLCRPSAAVFIVAVLLVVFFWQRDFSRTEENTDIFTHFFRPRSFPSVRVKWIEFLYRRPVQVSLSSLLRNEFWPMAITAATLLAAYLLVNRLQSGQWGGDYTAVARFTVRRAPIWVALYGHFLSPARGLLVYSPFFGLLLVGLFVSLRRIWQRPLVWLVFVWGGLHLLVTARAASWWGGVAFGPRLLTELIPGLVLLSALVWREMGQWLGGRSFGLLVGGYLVLAAWAIYVNSYQGLFNAHTLRWNQNAYPLPVHNQLGDLFDWRYPQFMADNEMICGRDRAKMEQVLALEPAMLPYHWGRPLSFDADSWQNWHNWLVPDLFDHGRRRVILTDSEIVSRRIFPVILSERASANSALFIGWSSPMTDFRWSECPSAAIVWRTEPGEVPASTLDLQVVAGAYQDQAVRLLLNGTEIGTAFFAGPAVPARVVHLPFDAALVRPDAFNELEFRFAEPAVPSLEDPRQLALAFVELRISPVAGPR